MASIYTPISYTRLSTIKKTTGVDLTPKTSSVVMKTSTSSSSSSSTPTIPQKGATVTTNRGSKSSSSSSSRSGRSSSGGGSGSRSSSPSPYTPISTTQLEVVKQQTGVDMTPKTTRATTIKRVSPVTPTVPQKGATLPKKTISSRSSISSRKTTPEVSKSSAYTGGKGVISAASKKEARAMRLQRTPVIGNVANFLSGFRSTFLVSPKKQQENLAYRDIRSLPGDQAAGAVLGNVGNIYTISAGAGAAPKAIKAARGIGTAAKASKVGQAATSAYKATQATRVGRFLTDIGVTTLKGVGIVEGSKATGKVTASTEQKEVMKDPAFNQILAKGYQAESSQVSSEAWYKGLAYEGVSSLISSKEGKKAFETAVRDEFKARGYTGRRLETAVSAAKRQKVAGGVGESLALLEISRSSEKIGRREVTKAFSKAGQKGVSFPSKQAFGKVFGITAPNIAQAGFVEGFSQEISQQQARGRKKDIKQAGLMGGFGAVSAGLIGGTIAGSRVTKPTTSKVIEGITYITDPYEKPGDLLADLGESIAKRRGKTIQQPAIFKPFDPKDVVRVTAVTPTSTQTKGKRKGGKPTSVIFPGVTPTPTPVTIPNFVPTPTPTPSPSPTPTPTKKTVPIFPNIPIPPISPTPTPINQPTKTETPVNTDIPVNTNTPIFTAVNIPVITPFARVPPPMPLALPSGAGAAGTKKGKSLKYVNELDLGMKFLRKQLKF
jgi:hypothetical protein